MLLLGDNLLPLLVLALGAALAVGNALALLRPPRAEPGDGELSRPPTARTVAMVVVGCVASAWALASLVQG